MDFKILYCLWLLKTLFAVVLFLKEPMKSILKVILFPLLQPVLPLWNCNPTKPSQHVCRLFADSGGYY